ncbi:MAG: enoyl-CoA hydratase [Rhodobacteraceae bacterium]|nr:enoyl-CoA hydratase [Paracoccaceae bacterium]|tara:strand:+ start:11031 stop:11825 length:795 start_codon:yes stop_codon:yes gene_type:complete
MEKEYKTIKVEVIKDYITLVTLNRPESANAFNTLMARELIHLFENLSMTPVDCRVVIITGSGERAFCAGGDLKERDGMTDSQWVEQHLVYEKMARTVIEFPIPIIGAINGAAYGGGCELVAMLDFVYASDNAKFAQTEVKLGIIPGAGGTQTLTRAIGERRAKELILTGKVFNAQEALDWGLVNKVLKISELLPTVLKTAQIIADNAPIAVRQAKQAIHKGLQMSLSDGMSFEIEAYNRTVPTKDRIEGVKAFNEKRPPIFKGR